MPNHPVVHSSCEDANSYCEWKGTRLPSESEFGYAARGGLEWDLDAQRDEFIPRGAHQASMWQGPSPHQDRDLVGFRSHDPVKQFPANGNALYDMADNVWNWVNDWYAPDYFRRSPVHNQQGPR